MFKKIKELNPKITILSIHDEEFKTYGRVIDMDSKDILNACVDMNVPQKGTLYHPSVEKLEQNHYLKTLSYNIFGGLDTEIGVCCGKNTQMNALEYHKSSEVNIAVTPLVLILGNINQIKINTLDSNELIAFYVDKGEVVELFSTTLHYCPCQVCDSGFFSIVILPNGTNTPLISMNDDKLLYQKNKWILCHNECNELINDGIYQGIYGPNHKIIY